MSEAAHIGWLEANQRDLMSALGEVRIALERSAAQGAQAEPAEERPQPAPLRILTTAFGLSRFERAILLLCAGMELDSRFAALCAAAEGERGRPYPSFGLALSVLPEPHWTAMIPAAPLRHWRLIECTIQSGGSLLTAPLRIDERVLHFLTGIRYLDERLSGLVEPVQDDQLVASHRDLARRIATTLSGSASPTPLIQLCGADAATRRAVAAGACGMLSLRLHAAAAEHVPPGAAELDAFARLWERETALDSAALYLEAESLDRADGKAVAQVSRLVELLRGPVLLGTHDPWRALRRPTLCVEVRKPTQEEQGALWHNLLAATPLPTAARQAGGVNGQAYGHVNELVAQFNLSVPSICASMGLALSDGNPDEAPEARLWNACRAQARLRLDDLAQRIEPFAGWDDLVLPDAEKRLLRDIAAQVARRATVYGTWGFARRNNRGLGISALFVGPSGTGKTMASEVLARALRLDLYHIDLAGVVSKYIGETEKNLRRVFDAAEDSGAILFFDEADALFGKRSEVKDSHDRYANIEVSYLLQRMEAYRGLAVLATNNKGAVDTAFLRRIRFVVNFPFPDARQRAEIWRHAFPSSTPTDGLDVARLARLNVAGGNIRNIALNAAFHAADAGEPVRMTHILRATRAEFAKLDKPLTEIDIWEQG
jgi:hypothetical protein